jgi:hypothetical protein
VNELLAFLSALADQDAHAWTILILALPCAAAVCVVAAIVVTVVQWWRESRRWRRFVRAHGGDEVAAVGTVVIVEADYEYRIQRSVPKWRRALSTDGDA